MIVKIKVVKKQLNAELRGFQFAGLHETEGLNMMIQGSAEKQTKFLMNWELRKELGKKLRKMKSKSAHRCIYNLDV